MEWELEREVVRKGLGLLFPDAHTASFSEMVKRESKNASKCQKYFYQNIFSYDAVSDLVVIPFPKATCFEPAACQNFANASGMVWLQDLTLRRTVALHKAPLDQ